MLRKSIRVFQTRILNYQQVAAFSAAPNTAKRLDLSVHGLKIDQSVPQYRNLSYDQIYQHEVEAGETVTSNGTVTVDTGKFTGRSPKDKYFVDQKPSNEKVWWDKIRKLTLPTYNKLFNLVADHYNKNAKKVYVFDGYCGASEASRKKVRFITEIAWQHHFVTNMFIRPKTAEEIENFKPDFTIINGCRVSNPDWKADGMNSENFVSFNVENKTAIIGGTFYGGEMKKGIFSMMNYWLPLNGVMSMHCSANIGKERGDTALYFGLSGTGKTTLSADPNRQLIGDDEHGWDDNGIFNLEGGCYAKTINLTEATEPDIYRAIKRDALLENVWLDEKNVVDYFNTSKTQNGRVSYPIFHINDFKADLLGGHPERIFFLTCDAFGVLPPISILSPEQAMYHFLSGYTAKVAGTERGITEPEATFSACFGAAFLSLHPTKYADLFKEKLKKYNSKVYLVNTGWSGGAYGVGKRMSIKATRSCIDRALDGTVDTVETRVDERFGFKVPVSLPGVDATLLDPQKSWADKAKYHETANKLVDMFQKNYKEYVQPGMTDYTSFGPSRK